MLGGVAVFIAFLISIMVNGIYSLELRAILIASAMLFLIGVADDIKEIPAWIRLLVQIASTVVVMSCGTMLQVIPISMGVFLSPAIFF